MSSKKYKNLAKEDDVVTDVSDKADVILLNAEINARQSGDTQLNTNKVNKSAFAVFDSITIDNTATQKEMRIAMQSILAGLKGLKSCVVLSLVCGSLCAEVTRETNWEDVPPQTKIATVVDLSHGGGGGGVNTNAVEDISDYRITNAVYSGWYEPTNTTHGVTNKLATVRDVAGKADKSELYAATNDIHIVRTDRVAIELKVSGMGGIKFDNNNNTGITLGGAYTDRDILVTLPCNEGTLALTSQIPTIPSTTALLKGNGSGGIVAATAGTDYATNAYTKSEADGRYLQTDTDYGVIKWETNNTLMISTALVCSYGPLKALSLAYFDMEKMEDTDVGTAINGKVSSSTIDGVTYKNASQILTTAENTAGTIVARGYTPTNAVVALSRSVQYVSPNGGTITVLKPTAIAGGIRDWVIYAYPTADAALCLTNLTHARFADDSVTNTLPANVYTAIYLTEIDPATETFAIGRAKLEKGW